VIGFESCPLELGKVEDEIFRNRKEREKADRERQKQRAKRSRIV
jgi:hypothetical protein